MFGIPSLLDLMEHIVGEGYDSLHVATPGPLGIGALVAGIALDLPVVGAYHTDFAEHAQAISGDEYVAEIVNAAVRHFYERCSMVTIPSHSTELTLTKRGYRVRGFQVLDHGANSDETLDQLFTLHARISGLESELAQTA
ncbi:hypothetical protein BH23ACT11_BH23ACT11_29140 [soil metagenome]